MDMFAPKEPAQQEDARSAENRQFNFAREQTIVGNAVDAQTEELDRKEFDVRSDLIKWQQELGDELEELKMKLRSMKKTDDGWVPKTFKQYVKLKNNHTKLMEFNLPPLANEVFVDKVDIICSRFMSRNLINSNLSQIQINYRLKSTMNTVASLVSNGFDQFEVEFNNYDLIMEMIKTTIIPSPMRALNDGERRHIRTFNKRVETYNENPNQDSGERKRLFGVF